MLLTTNRAHRALDSTETGAHHEIVNRNRRAGSHLARAHPRYRFGARRRTWIDRHRPDRSRRKSGPPGLLGDLQLRSRLVLLAPLFLLPLPQILIGGRPKALRRFSYDGWIS